MKMKFFIMIFLTVILSSCSNKIDKVRISVDSTPSSADVKTEILKQTGSKGVSYYDVLITNASDSNVTLHEINIDFSPLVVVSPNAEILAGGSDMGRTPIQRYLPTDKNIKSGMFLLVKNSDSDFLLIGILSWKVFLAKLMFGSNGMQIKTDADGKLLLPGDNVHFEKIVTIHGDNWQSLLDLYAIEIARENNISKTKEVDYKGWSTWDYYGRSFTQNDIYNNIEALAKLDTSANLIQIDGGWWTERGDYLTVRPDFTDGMKGIAKYISNHGYTPGIHLDGFRADLASNVAKQHPEYFLKDQNGDIIVTRNQKYDRVMNYIYFDYSHPDARNYIKNVLTIIKNDWGFKYFKIDFMRFGLKDDMLKVCPDVTEIQAHIAGMTHVERFRAGITAIKEALGDDVYFLGCSAVFGPAIGFVDGMRTGGDISPRFDFYKTRCLQNGGNYYLHKKVFNCDFDYLVFRNKHDEDEHVQTSTNKYGGDITLNEAKMWADYSTLFGSAKLASDNLQTLRDERKELIKHSFSFTGCDEFLPVDLWQHARDKEDAFSLFLGREGDNIYLVAFNWDDSATEMTITGFAHKNNQFLTGYPEQNKITIENRQFTLKMEKHSSHIFEYNGNDSYKSLKENLEIKLESHK